MVVQPPAPEPLPPGTLPPTGSGTGPLAGVAVFLVLLGAALVAFTTVVRRRAARVG